MHRCLLIPAAIALATACGHTDEATARPPRDVDASEPGGERATSDGLARSDAPPRQTRREDATGAAASGPTVGSRGALQQRPQSAEVADRDARVAELVDRLRPHLHRSSDGLVVEKLPGGGARIDLQGRYQHAVMVTRDDDGHVRTECVSHPEAAAHALRTGTETGTGGAR